MTDPARPTLTMPPGHIPALDGLRGVAVLLVMTFHFSVVPRHEHQTALLDDWFRDLVFTGWSGVDLFFVLSGFLITGILLRTRDAPNYFKAFYARRALRIFPLYYAFLAVTIFAVLPIAGRFEDRIAGLSAVSTQLGDLPDRQAWFWLYASNIFSFFHDGEKAVYGMGHFWSLAIEEQYYLVWSPIVFLFRARPLAWVCAAIIAAVTAYRVWCVLQGMPAYTVQTFTLTRVDSIVFGSLAACLLHNGIPARWATAARRAVVPCWIVAFGVQIALGSTLERPVALMLSPTLFALAFLVTVLGVTAKAASQAPQPILRNRVLMHFGAISYGLYVFHVPIRGVLLPLYERAVPQTLILGSKMHWTLGFIALCFVVSFAVAQLSWMLFESRILRLKRFVPYKSKDVGTSVSAP